MKNHHLPKTPRSQNRPRRICHPASWRKDQARKQRCRCCPPPEPPCCLSCRLCRGSQPSRPRLPRERPGWPRSPLGPRRSRCSHSQRGCESNRQCPFPRSCRCLPQPWKPTRTGMPRSRRTWPPSPPCCLWCRLCRGSRTSRLRLPRGRPGSLWSPTGEHRPRCSHSLRGCGSNKQCPCQPPCRYHPPPSPDRRTCPKAKAPSSPGCSSCRR